MGYVSFICYFFRRYKDFLTNCQVGVAMSVLQIRDAWWNRCESAQSYFANNKHAGFDPTSLSNKPMPCLPQHIPSLESESAWWERQYHWQMTVSTPILCSLRTCPHGSRHVPSMVMPALYLLVSKHVKMKRKISGSSLCYLYSISCYHVGVKFHRNLFFHFVFLLFPVRHYVATAIITHRYKYHPLPLLVDLQIFSVSTPFSNTISCETSIYKIDKGKLW